MTPFVIAICALFTISVLFYVFYLPGTLKLGPEKSRVSYLRERKDVVYENLRDLNFEYKAGKLSDSDFNSMRDSMEQEAAAVLAEIDQLERVAVKPYTYPAPGSPTKGARV